MVRGGHDDPDGTAGIQVDEPPAPVRPDLVLSVVAGTFAFAGAVAIAGLWGELPFHEFLFEAFMHVGLAVIILGGAVYLHRSELPQSTWWSVVGGYVAGICFIDLLLVWSNLSELLAGAALRTLWNDFVFFGNLGGLFGFVTGVTRARSRYNRQLLTDLEASNEIVESAEEALWMFRADWSEVLYINSTYEDLYGQSVERLREDPTAVLEAVHPDDRQRAREAMDELSEGNSIDIEVRVNADEGYGRWAWVKGQPVYRGDELYAVSGFARDITDRKERQRRFEAIFNQTFQFTGLMEPDGTLIEANDTALEFGGIDREDVIGEKLWDTYWFEDLEETRQQAKACFDRAAGGEFVREELEVRGADGTAIIDFSIRPVTDEDGEVTLLIPEGRNITDRKRYEQRVIDLHETTRRLFRAGSKSEAADVATTDARTRLGMPVSAMLLTDDERDALVPVATTPAADDLLDRDPTGPGDEGPFRAVYEDGEARIYEGDGPAGLEHGLILPIGDHGVFVVGTRDGTEPDEQVESLAKLLATNLEAALARIEQQRDLEARQRELERQNERLDEFASVVSHDLRNPLTVAKGRLELLDEEMADSEHLVAAREALDRMETLIDDLLMLARAGDVVDDPEPIDLATHVDNCWRNVETNGATLTVSLDTTVLSDETRLAQLFENLFRNSIEHGGDDVTIRVGELDDGFYVEDDGPGIPPEEREDVLRAGYTTAADGNGFGLSIVAKIAESQGWDVTVAESEAGGARFEFTGVTASPPRPTSETP